MTLQGGLPSNVVTLIVGVLGFLGGIFPRVVKHWLEKRTRRKKLRSALIGEIRSPKGAIDEAAEADSSADPDDIRHSRFPNKVYTAQMDDIGLLSSDEIHHVVDYYNIVDVASEQLDPSEKYGEPDDFLDTVSNMKAARDDAEYVLEAHARWFGRSRFLLRKWKDGDWYWRDDTDTNDSESTVDDQG